jgi:hypothetical protein
MCEGVANFRIVGSVHNNQANQSEEHASDGVKRVLAKVI